MTTEQPLRSFLPGSWGDIEALDPLELLECARSFRVPGLPEACPISIDLAGPAGVKKWAVRNHGARLSREGEWLYEPLPSSRSDEFIASTCFDTLAEAIGAARLAFSRDAAGG